MSKLSDYLAAQTAFNQQQSDATDSIVASITGLSGDVKTLNDTITTLQNSPGGVTPADQATIDTLQAQGAALVAKAQAAANAAAALDSQTPPTPPPAPAA